MKKKTGQEFDEYADILLLKNHHYHGIVDTAHDRLGPLIEDLTDDAAEIYVHNPPRALKEYLEQQFSNGDIHMDVSTQQYEISRDASLFAEKIKQITTRVIGQRDAIAEVSKSLWYLTTMIRTKPYVVMLYGNSSLGKTELAREIADNFFEQKFLEKHLSMFKNDNYSGYFFGDEPNRKSIGYDLLERESNLIFFDEIDKCPEHFYSAFYTLFDNEWFKDKSYDVNISGTMILLTSNFHTEDEMKSHLGLPIFYRIDKFIRFDDFNVDTIHAITVNEITDRSEEYSTKLTFNQIYDAVSSKINISNENGRTIKNKVQQVIEDLLFEDVPTI